MESFGYYGRAWGSRDAESIKAFVLQDLLVTPAPIFLAASIYIMFARFVVALRATDYCSLRPGVLTMLFILGDVICFITQFAGSGLQIPESDGLRHAGWILVVAGLIIQILLFMWFIGITWAFYTRLSNSTRGVAIPWKRYMRIIFICSGAILVRNIVRTVEYAQGPGGFVVSHEAFIYIFDALPMALVIIGLLVVHPTRAVRKLQANMAVAESLSSSSSEEGATSALSQGKVDV